MARREDSGGGKVPETHSVIACGTGEMRTGCAGGPVIGVPQFKGTVLQFEGITVKHITVPGSTMCLNERGDQSVSSTDTA